MTKWVIINNGNSEMSVGKNGVFFDVNSAGLANNIHAVQWDGSAGEVEYKDTATNLATYNADISSFSDYAFAETAWDNAYATALSQAKQIAYDGAYQPAYDTAYDAAIANGDSDADAVAAGTAAGVAAGNAARDAVTSI